MKRLGLVMLAVALASSPHACDGAGCALWRKCWIAHARGRLHTQLTTVGFVGGGRCNLLARWSTDRYPR